MTFLRRSLLVSIICAQRKAARCWHPSPARLGIIGIALILSLSTGIQAYVNSIQGDTLSSYPITIQQEESGIMSALISQGEGVMGGKVEQHDLDLVYANDRMYELFNPAFTGRVVQNKRSKHIWTERWTPQQVQPISTTMFPPFNISTVGCLPSTKCWQSLADGMPD